MNWGEVALSRGEMRFFLFILEIGGELCLNHSVPIKSSLRIAGGLLTR